MINDGIANDYPAHSNKTICEESFSTRDLNSDCHRNFTKKI